MFTRGWQGALRELPSKLVPEAGPGWGSTVLSPHREDTVLSPHREDTGRNASPVQSGEGEGSEGAEGRELNLCCEEDPGPSTQRTSCFDKNTVSRGPF